MNFLFLEIEEYSSEAINIYKKYGTIYTLPNVNKKIIEVLVIRISEYIDEYYSKVIWYINFNFFLTT